MVFTRLLFIAMLIALPAAARAQLDGTCPQPDAQPTLLVNVQIQEPRVDNSLSRNALKQFDIATPSPYNDRDQNLVHVNGLMRGSITVETNTTLAWQRTRNAERNCFWYNQVNINLKLLPTVYIAREIPAGTCLYREVLNHEHKHFAVDSDIAREYQVILQTELTKFLRLSSTIGPYPPQQNAEAQQWLTGRFEQALRPLYEQLKADRVKRQAGVDTIAEYERVARACPSERGFM